MSGGLVVVGSFAQVLDALAARAALESVGIPAFVPDEHAATMLPHTMPGVAGVRLQVRASDELRARRVLKRIDRRNAKRGEHEHEHEHEDHDPLAPPEPECPGCSSKYVYFGYPPRLFYVSLLFFGLPLIGIRKRFSCRSCDHEWFDLKAREPTRALAGPYRKAGGRPSPLRTRAARE